MEKTASRLKWIFYVALAAALLVVVLFETNVLTEGVWTVDKQKEYFAAVSVELFTLIAVPLALRMFRFSSIRRRLYEGKASALSFWGTLRILILALPMVLSLVFYYLFMNASFAYIAIILLISMLFVYPSLERCVSETTAPQND